MVTEYKTEVHKKLDDAVLTQEEIKEINRKERAKDKKLSNVQKMHIANSESSSPEKPDNSTVKENLTVPEHKMTSLAIPAESLTKLRAVNNERRPSSISRDNAAQNKKTIESTDPRAEQWKRHPGSMDVLGVDTPPNVIKMTSVPKRRIARKTFGRR